MEESVRLADHIGQISKMYFEEGRSYADIAKKYGKTREAVRQFLNKNFPDRESGKEFRTKINEQRRAVAEETAEINRKPVGNCVICGKEVFTNYGGPRAKVRTCSPEHAKLWVTARYNLDPDFRKRQRASTARSILRNKDKYRPSSIKWAKKVLEDEMPPRRAYRLRDSQSSEAFEQVMEIRKKEHGVG